MASHQEYSCVRREVTLESHKATDLEKLLLYLSNNTNIKQYFMDCEAELKSRMEDYIASKLKLLHATNKEMNRLRYLIQELSKSKSNNSLDLGHLTPIASTEISASSLSLSLSPIILASPDIDMQPIDLQDVPQTFRPRRYSTIPLTYIGKYAMESIKAGNGVDFPFPNDKVTVQYAMFAIDGILDLMESYVHEIIDLTSSKYMIGLKTGILSMSMNQKCKLWIPRKLTARHNSDDVVITHKTDVLVEITLLNIIRSDIYKEETYTNDIILNAVKSKRQRANTVSFTPPPLLPPLSAQDINHPFEIPDLDGFGGHIHHPPTDIALEQHKNDMKVLINEIRLNQSNSVTINLETPNMEFDGEFDEAEAEAAAAAIASDESDTNMVEISGTKSMWFNRYGSLSRNKMVEQCMTLCSSIESCQCTKRLLMILKIYQSIMYNRKQTFWCKQYLDHELVSMYHAVHKVINYANECIMNDFYHCRFYHGHFSRWYNFCRTHYEENYCVYAFIQYEDSDGDTSYKRHCMIYQRYHRNKAQSKALRKRRELFKIQSYDDNGLSDEETNEIVTLQICDMIHCFIFHSSQEPYLMYHNHQESKTEKKNKMKVREQNKVEIDKFTLELQCDDDVDKFNFDGEHFGVVISYKDNTYNPRYASMKEELLYHPDGVSIHQYADVCVRAMIFKQTFIGRQMVNFFGKHIHLQQVIAIMCYTNYSYLQKAFRDTLHCHNLDYDEMEAIRKSHCETFWYWSKMLFSVVDNFGDPIAKDCEFTTKFGNIAHLTMSDLQFYTESVISVCSDKLVFASEDHGSVIISIGAQRFGSLYFDVSLLSDYPHENECILGPSQHLEIRNVLMKNYDHEIYFGAMYFLDALIGHKLSYDYHENKHYQTYLAQIIKNIMAHIDGLIDELQSGPNICYQYWKNKTILRINLKVFEEYISMKQLLEYFLIQSDDENKQISFHFMNALMLFPNVEQIEISEIDLNILLCTHILQLIETFHGTEFAHKLNKIQLFGAQQHSIDAFATKFDEMGWFFQHKSEGNWLLTKR